MQIFSKERATLVKNYVKLEYAILGHPTCACIGEAYVSAIVERLPDPAEATYLITAAHIVPYAIGEVIADYIFGVRPEEGYEAIWSHRNGLLLDMRIEKALDVAQVVPVPTDDFYPTFNR